MKILLLDIETAPNKVYTWGLFKQNIALNQIEEAGYTLCWAAKWVGKKKVLFASTHKDGKKKMLKDIHDLLTEADVVIHYNGSSFDVPTLNREFLTACMPPPAPFQEIDLLKTCRARFRFLSNKLDFIAQQLGCGGKLAHKGMELWRGCMEGRAADWRIMERYNKRDVVILEGVYHKLLPWIQPHPNMGVYMDSEKPTCPHCGGTHMQARGHYYTNTMRYKRFKCMAKACGKWSRSRVNNLDVETKQNLLVGVK